MYLNHGSFGACPRVVIEAQRAIIARAERELVRFFVEDLRPLMDGARAAIGAFVGCDGGDIAPVSNATSGVATVLANLDLKPGDELLTNNHEYPSCQNNLRRVAERSGAKVVVANVPFPLHSAQQVVDAILGAVTARARLALISHVTSPSGVVFPVEQLVPLLHTRGVETLIDGAHAPGMIEVDLAALRPTYYTANCHKWICSPKGSAFLYVDRARRERAAFRPVILSNNAENPVAGRDQFLTEFDYVGTSDYSAFLTIPAAIEAMGSLVPGGWNEIRTRNRALCLRARAMLAKRWGTHLPAPESMIATLGAVELPMPRSTPTARGSDDPLRHYAPMQAALIERHGIQVPVWGVPDSPMRTLRISAQLYNSMEQYEYLAGAVEEELKRGM